MKKSANQSRNFVWSVLKRTIPTTVFVSAVSSALAYGFYEIAFHVSLWPFWLAIAMLVFAVMGPSIIVLIDGGQSRLVTLGYSNLFMLTAFYFLFGIVGFFFYFLFAPMPSFVHVGGLGIGVVMTGYWMIFTARDVNKALSTSRFVEEAFEDAGKVWTYRLQNIAKLEAAQKSRGPIGKLHMYFVLLVAPFSLVMGRLLAPIFGPHGPILLGSLILFPVSQWLAGIGVRQYIVMIRLPRMLERNYGKPVIVTGDEA